MCIYVDGLGVLLEIIDKLRVDMSPRWYDIKMTNAYVVLELCVNREAKSSTEY